MAGTWSRSAGVSSKTRLKTSAGIERHTSAVARPKRRMATPKGSPGASAIAPSQSAMQARSAATSRLANSVVATSAIVSIEHLPTGMPAVSLVAPD